MVEITQIEAGPFDSNVFLIKDQGSAVLIEHFDHSGGAKYLMEAFSVPLYGSPECARAMREADPNLTGSFLFGVHMDPVMEITEIGPELEIGNLRFQVHSTPGHAPGLVCLIESTEKHLFCGDLVFCDGGVGRWDLPGGDLSLLKESIQRSLQWEIASLYPGHGRYETRDPKAQMELANRMLSMM
jgi:glyoxylase-like metal-dependent hydrolase (beta-lactamase superfamily II)